jgi:hypothetical protein
MPMPVFQHGYASTKADIGGTHGKFVPVTLIGFATTVR